MKRRKLFILFFWVVLCAACGKRTDEYVILENPDFFMTAKEADEHLNVEYTITNQSDTILYFGDFTTLMVQKEDRGKWIEIKKSEFSSGEHTSMLLGLEPGKSITKSFNANYVYDTYGSGRYRFLLRTVQRKESEKSKEGPYLSASFELP